MSLSQEELIAFLSARIYFYAFIHRTLGEAITEQSVEAFQSTNSLAILNSYLVVTGKNYTDSKTEANKLYDDMERCLTQISSNTLIKNADYKSLKVQYDAAFNIPGQKYIHPWESTYLNKERTLFNENTSDVRKVYSSYNFELEARNHFPEDHVAAMCDFISQCTQELLPEKPLNISNISENLKSQHAFISHHLLSWITQFKDKAHEVCVDEPYLSFIDFACSFILFDVTHLDTLSLD